MLGDEIDLETTARVGNVRFWGSWQVLSVALQRCIKELGISEPWRLRKLAFTYSYSKCYVLRAVAESKKTGSHLGSCARTTSMLKSAPAASER